MRLKIRRPITEHFSKRTWGQAPYDPIIGLWTKQISRSERHPAWGAQEQAPQQDSSSLPLPCSLPATFRSTPALQQSQGPGTQQRGEAHRLRNSKPQHHSSLLSTWNQFPSGNMPNVKKTSGDTYCNLREKKWKLESSSKQSDSQS